MKIPQKYYTKAGDFKELPNFIIDFKDDFVPKFPLYYMILYYGVKVCISRTDKKSSVRSYGRG